MEKGVYKLANLIAGRRSFYIPIYQRHYSWGPKQWDDLWNDLYYLELPKTHYFGQIILLEKVSEKKQSLWFDEFAIVDGQQRLATVLILLKELIAALEKEKALAPEEISRLKEDYIRSGSIYKLELLGDDQEFFRRYIIEDEPVPPGTLTPSQKRLLNARDFFRRKLNEEKIALSEEDFKKFMLNLLRKIETIDVMVYPLRELAEAARIFELVNDRGKDLTNLEKTKSFLMYLIYLASPIEEQERFLRDLNDSFANIFKAISIIQETEFGKNLNEDDLQRYHFIMSATNEMLSKPVFFDIPDLLLETSRPALSKIQIVVPRAIAAYNYLNYLKKYLLSEYREDKPKCLKSVLKYAKSLEKFFLLSKSIMTTNNNVRKDVAQLLENIFSLRRIANFYPLIISCWSRFNDNSEYLKEILNEIEISIFRVYAIGRRRADTGRSMLFNLAYEIYAGNKTFDEAIAEIREFIKTYEPDDRFERDLKAEDFYQRVAKNDLRYFFYWYEKYLRETEKEDVEFTLKEILSYDDNNRPKYEIEHIWPETPLSNIKEEDSKVYREYVHRLGNLTLATKKWNRSLGHKPFLIKRQFYKKSIFRCQRELSTYETWGPKEIEERTKKLIGFSMKRWPL